MPRCSPAMTTRRLGKVGRMDERRSGLISMSLHQELPASYRSDRRPTMQNALFEPAPFDPRLPVAARGTEGSNPAPSSGESGANLTFGYESQIRE